jgi:hypothetical protein
VTSGYGQVTSGYWPAVVFGTVELLILIMYTTAAVRHEVRRRRGASTLLSVLRRPDELPGEAGDPPLRCWALIAEAIIVRERLSGETDAETYRTRMNDLARQASRSAVPSATSNKSRLPRSSWCPVLTLRFW